MGDMILTDFVNENTDFNKCKHPCANRKKIRLYTQLQMCHLTPTKIE